MVKINSQVTCKQDVFVINFLEPVLMVVFYSLCVILVDERYNFFFFLVYASRFSHVNDNG